MAPEIVGILRAKETEQMSVPSYVLKAVTSVFLASVALSLTPIAAHADLVTSQPSPASNSSSSAALPDGEQRYIVKYDNDVNAEAESQSLEQKGIEVKDTLSHTMKASVVVATSKEIESLQKSESVASIEKDTRISISGATSIWGLDRVDQRSGRDGQYSIGDEGAGVNIYVVDTGLNFSHTEFTGRVPTSWWGIHDGRAANDCNGHGTHVAGSAAGTTYGVAKKANIIPVRVVECDGSGWNSTAVAGVDWAVAHHVAGQPAVMNLSVGGFTSASFDQAVQSAINDGITVVAAAGNDGVDACSSSPARIPAAITVAATNINDAQASWSNYGSCVDIQAPGVSIRSAWNNAPTGYNTLDGTSMATPHVSGAAAILLSRDRSLSPAQVHQSIINNATNGVVISNKGATPNRLLYIPAPATGPPSCANLKPGDAWAGVGTHCGLQGTVASAASAESAEPSTETTAPVTATADPVAPDTAEGVVPVPLPAPSPDAAEIGVAPSPVPSVSPTPSTAPETDTAPAPVNAPVQAPAPSQQLALAPMQYVPAAGNASQEVATQAEVAEVESVPSEAPSPTATPSSIAPAAPAAVPTALPVRSQPMVNPLDESFDGTPVADSVEAGETTNSIWTVTIGVVLVLIGGSAIAYAVRSLRRKLHTS